MTLEIQELKKKKKGTNPASLPQCEAVSASTDLVPLVQVPLVGF